MPSRLSLIAALLLPLAVQAEPADTRALLADSLADSQAQVEAAEQSHAPFRKQGGAALCQARTHRTAGVRPSVARPGREKALALPSPRQTERQAAAPGGFDERGFLDAQIRQQDRLVARFEESPGTPPILTCAASPTNGWRASTTTANWPTSCVAAAPTERRDRLAQCRARTCRALWRITPSAWDRPAAWRQAGAWPARN